MFKVAYVDITSAGYGMQHIDLRPMGEGKGFKPSYATRRDAIDDVIKFRMGGSKAPLSLCDEDLEPVSGDKGWIEWHNGYAS